LSELGSQQQQHLNRVDQTYENGREQFALLSKPESKDIEILN
jgi:hypothetical protein